MLFVELRRIEFEFHRQKVKGGLQVLLDFGGYLLFDRLNISAAFVPMK